jgi:AcrR family transcriptional regulator
VDHAQRRRELSAALVRSARVRGLHASGFREVAAEAGVSVNLVQYYFPTKTALLAGGLRHIRERIDERLAGSDSVRELLVRLLPTDESSADLYRLHAAYAALAFTEPELAAVPGAAGPDELHPRLTELLGDRTRATALLALCTGLSAYLTSGYLTPAEAVATLDATLGVP